MSTDRAYDLATEQAIIADLETVDKLKAELISWRKGPWIRKQDHDEEIHRLKSAIILFRDAKGRYHTQLAAERLMRIVEGEYIQSAKEGKVPS